MRRTSSSWMDSAAPIRVTFLALAITATQSRPAAALTFDERVAAQERIERAYVGHRIGATRPFEEAIPKGLAAAKVRQYLKQSAALEAFWDTPVTAEMLRAEMERQVRQTRMPERLRELHAALGDDPVLVQECLARPALVDRLVRSFYAFDGRFHALARATAETLRGELQRDGIDARAADSLRRDIELLALDPDEIERTSGRDGEDGVDSVTLPPDEFERWRRRTPGQPGEIGPVIERRDSFVILALADEGAGRVRIATFTIPKRSWDEWWEEASRRLDERSVEVVADGDLASIDTRLDSASKWAGDRTPSAAEATAVTACLPDDTWDNGSLDDLPLARVRHAAVWTGTLMLVWGGQDSSSQPLATGGRYDPATDTWSPISTSGAPSPRWDHTAVWTSDRMVVWGGHDGSSYLGTGGRYDPSLDAWTPTSTTGAPSGRASHTAAWTGARMIVWGGYDGASYPGSGGRYDPGTDSWTGTSATGSPTGRRNHTVVWTGSRMIVWGGYDGSYPSTGGRYDPVADAWTATATTLAPGGRDRHTAVWTGSRMIVWGGGNAGTALKDDGSRYDPVADSWTPITLLGVPQARQHHSSIWTGSVMVVWGGSTSSSSSSSTQSGGRYDPVADSWSTTSIVGAPRSRFRHTAVWTGTQMVVWGGDQGLGSLPSSGGRYNPVTNAWTPTSIGPPVGWTETTNVWTGNLMIVWGGRREGVAEALGGRYDPTIDSWTATSVVGAPTPRTGHTAVWTGGRMVIWGGDSFSPTNTGGRYDPTADTWQPVSTLDAPSPRVWHTAVWTGSLMVIWGGTSDPVSTSLSSGARYDPVADLWAVTSPWGAPIPRYAHTATWTGTWMVVWGGRRPNFSVLDSGARYEPVTDTWEPTSLAGAPTAREGHSAVSVSGRVVVWGGTGPAATGARYDPQGDVWLPTTLTGAPSARGSHSAISTGSEVIVWGGSNGVALLDSGARYNPATDSWLPTSAVGTPPKREGHTAVWTGSSMIVWGGSYGAGSGGRYALGHATDDDGDGSSECGGDCDDAQPAIHPGAVESCDGRDNDCDAATDEDGDGDGVAVCLDCQDANPTVYATPGEVESLTLPSPTLLTWSPPAAPGGSATSYSTLRSTAAGNFAGGATCVESQDGSDTSATDGAVPPSKGTFFYLVRAENLCPMGQGTLGMGSGGNQRLGRTCP